MNNSYKEILEELKYKLTHLERQLEIEIDGRITFGELQKLRDEIDEIKGEITKLEKKE